MDFVFCNGVGTCRWVGIDARRWVKVGRYRCPQLGQCGHDLVVRLSEIMSDLACRSTLIINCTIVLPFVDFLPLYSSVSNLSSTLPGILDGELAVRRYCFFAAFVAHAHALVISCHCTLF